MTKVRGDFNGLFGDLLCLSHSETAIEWPAESRFEWRTSLVGGVSYAARNLARLQKRSGELGFEWRTKTCQNKFASHDGKSA